MTPDFPSKGTRRWAWLADTPAHWAMGAIPEFAPIGENHLLRSTSVVQKMVYGDQSVSYKTYDPSSVELLRLNFRPTRVSAGGMPLAERTDLMGEGYMVQPLSSGDYVVRVRHLRSAEISIATR